MSEPAYTVEFVYQDGWGTSLRAIRHRLGLSQEELATSVGISPSYVSAIENDIRRPSPEIAERISKVLYSEESSQHGDGQDEDRPIVEESSEASAGAIIGDEETEPDWYAKLPSGLPAIVRTAAARQRAIDDLRNITDRLRETAPSATEVERRMILLAIESVDSAIDILSLADPTGFWSASEEQAVPVLRRVVTMLSVATSLVEGVQIWNDAAHFMERALQILIG